MDFPAALDQMSLLLSLNPSSVYKTSYYRKQTKNHWARDDPAFVLLLTGLYTISNICYAVAFSLGLQGFLRLLATNLLLAGGGGLATAAATRWYANEYLATHRSHSVKQNVELLYALDIHFNSSLLLFAYLHLLQFLLLPLLLTPTFLALLASNVLYAAATAHYWYITHLGYRALPFLKDTQHFLYPGVAAVGMAAVGVVAYPLGLSINVARLAAMVFL